MLRRLAEKEKKTSLSIVQFVFLLNLFLKLNKFYSYEKIFFVFRSSLKENKV